MKWKCGEFLNLPGVTGEGGVSTHTKQAVRCTPSRSSHLQIPLHYHHVYFYYLSRVFCIGQVFKHWTNNQNDILSNKLFT